MHLSVKNIGKLSEADIDLNGITVIAGENDTGKSTIGLLQGGNIVRKHRKIFYLNHHYTSHFLILEKVLPISYKFLQYYLLHQKLMPIHHSFQPNNNCNY